MKPTIKLKQPYRFETLTIRNKINENFKTNKLFKLTAKININLKIYPLNLRIYPIQKRKETNML
jgi:hypothetical protein